MQFQAKRHADLFSPSSSAPPLLSLSLGSRIPVGPILVVSFVKFFDDTLLDRVFEFAKSLDFFYCVGLFSLV